MSLKGREFIDFMVRRMTRESFGAAVKGEQSFTCLDGHDEHDAWSHIGRSGGVVSVNVAQEIDVGKVKRIFGRLIQIASVNGLQIRSIARDGQLGLTIELEPQP